MRRYVWGRGAGHRQLLSIHGFPHEIAMFVTVGDCAARQLGYPSTTAHVTPLQYRSSLSRATVADHVRAADGCVCGWHSEATGKEQRR